MKRRNVLAPSLVTASAVASLFAGHAANAEESAYCRKVRSRAASDAALLIAPAVRVEGIKLPSALESGGTIDPTATANNTRGNYQVRAGATWSPLNAYKGIRVNKMGDADCERHEAYYKAEDALRLGVEHARWSALKKQREYLDAKRSAWEAIGAKSEERLEQKIVTMLETDEIRIRVATLERLRAQTAGEIGRLEADNVQAFRGNLAAMIREADERSMAFEREASHVRGLDSWNVTMTGGYLPPIATKTSDFFGLVQVSYSLGGFSHNGHETDYLAARADELKNASYELRGKLEIYKSQVRSSFAQARQELEAVTRRGATLNAAHAALERAEARGTPHALAVIDLEMFASEADRVFLLALTDELGRSEEIRHAR